MKAVDLHLSSANKSTQLKEFAIKFVLIASSFVAILTTLGIIVSLSYEAFRFFAKVPLTEFLFGLDWSPQTAIREDQVGSSGAFGVIPLLTGTLLISLIAMIVATPLGLYSAVYLAEKLALAYPAIIRTIDGLTVRKVIVVPGRIINIVAS